jgi:heme/copper-type cytochrome/quinol oxidase subunit 1
MHSLVRRFIKTAVAFLFVGLVLGVWMIVQRELLGRYPSAYMISAHTHAILVGFVMSMILGVALWLFPRPAKGDRHYRPALAEAAYWLLLSGTVIRVAGELLRPSVSALWLGVAVVIAGVLQALAVVVFFFTMWSRIRGMGSQVREAQGERF